MQRHAGPVANREQWHVDLVPLRLGAAESATIEIIAQPKMERIDRPCIRKLLRSAADSMMHQMRGEPVGHEHAEDTAMEQRVTVDVGESFPRDNRLQRRRLLIGGEPLINLEIRNARKADITVAPRLRCCPFDGVIKINRFSERPRLALAGGFAAPAPVDPNSRVAARYPPLWVYSFPIHQRVGLLLQIVGRNPKLIFLIGPEIDQRRYERAVFWTEYVGHKPRAIAHRDLHILLDQDGITGSTRTHVHPVKSPVTDSGLQHSRMKCPISPPEFSVLGRKYFSVGYGFFVYSICGGATF